MLAREESSMYYARLIFAGFAVVSTWIVFWVPSGGGPPPIWSNQNIN